MNRLRKSRWYALLAWFLITNDRNIQEKLSDNHKHWIYDQFNRANIDTLLTAITQAEEIERNPRVRGSYESHIQRELRQDRTPKSGNLTPIRRIGVGYRDKGSLRPHHKKREFGMESWYSEDIRFLSPNLPDQEFVTAEEVLSQGTNLEHVRIFFEVLTRNREVQVLTTDRFEDLD